MRSNGIPRRVGVITRNGQAVGTVTVREDGNMVGGKLAKGRANRRTDPDTRKKTERKKNGTRHNSLRIFLASSAPGKVSLSFSEAWRLFFAPARSPFFCCARA